ncbi:hypothetical protein ASF41_10525 [Methylobacterium sp. Leaf111]|uniref:hypothetical protein n=1 Tax=Methylobacterium sp. Leaf111 TaxID=1736257 RepID=UPI0006FFDA58|nr:hypothetical protein [Methylobacterium sp. Leaf111]KQP60103.1 hypothetical protein ASF41_10525 [Methylobacterium sp. Leaf111]
MIRIIKHILVEPTADQLPRLRRIQAAVLARFPDATSEIVPGLLDDDLVVEVRLPLLHLMAWRGARDAWGDFRQAGDGTPPDHVGTARDAGPD